MFIQALESVGKVAGATVALQQEIVKKWIGALPSVPSAPASAEQVEKFQKKWIETASEQVRRQKEVFEAQFKAGMENIEKAFKVAEAKTADDVRAKTVELWQKCFEAARQASEAQIRENQVAAEKWFELLTTPLASGKDGGRQQ